jgi:ATP-dependent DNA ligase
MLFRGRGNLPIRTVGLISDELARGRWRTCIQYNEHVDGDGEIMFRHACKLGLEGIVCKRRDSTYRSGRTETWLKVKNPAAPGVTRFQDG